MATASEASQQANRSGMDPLRLVVIFYIITALILALFFGKMLELVWAGAGWSNPVLIEGLDWTLSSGIGIALGLGLVAFAWVNKRVRGLALESASELLKVTWPTWTETRVATVAVVIASLVAAFILFGIDTLAYQIMVEWLPRLWGNL
ncbi:MAG: preprotein translocase subunit SecE [Myxococcaceae bacterium]